MAKCPKCNRKKGKRRCPALDAQICESCCGRLRGGEIECTLECPVFSKTEVEGKLRQIEHAKRADEQNRQITDYHERIERLQVELERMVCSRDRSFNDVTDHEVMMAAEDALRSIEDGTEAEKGGEGRDPDLEELFSDMLRSGPACLGDLTHEEQRDAVAALVRSVQPYAQEGGGSRNYVDFLMRTVDLEYGLWRTSDATAEALRLMDDGRILAALDVLQRECDAHPGNAALHDLTARTYLRCERYEEAFDVAQKAIQISPKNVEFLTTMVQASASTGRTCAAWNVAKKALALDPPARERSALRDLQKRLAEAIQEQLGGRPHLDANKLAQFERATFAGLAAMRHGRLEEAEAQMRVAIDLDSKCADTQTMLGQIYAQQQRMGDARQAFGAALRLDPNHEMAQRALETIGSMTEGPADQDSGLIVRP